MKVFIRIVSYPFALLYGIVVHFRNWLYNNKLLYIYKPPIKTIVVGNLSVGGTGKTPHIEYLVRLLSPEFKLATLSRGYGRKTKGFRMANLNDTSQTLGDEPLQYFQKFMDIIVAVDNVRRRGIRKLYKQFPMLQVILLDDAFQHRSVQGGLQIVLSDYGHMYYDDRMLPTGTLREFSSGIKRADLIVVTKTPPVFSPIERRHILSRINPLPQQQVFFSYIKYQTLTHLFNKTVYHHENFKEILGKSTEILVFAGIANTVPLEDFVQRNSKEYKMMSFNDHHNFSLSELNQIKLEYEAMRSPKKIILTTEKDAMRLIHLTLPDNWRSLPVYYVSIAVQLHQQDEEKFNNHILNYVRTNKANN